LSVAQAERQSSEHAQARPGLQVVAGDRDASRSTPRRFGVATPERTRELELHVAELYDAHARHKRELGQVDEAEEAERLAREARERAERVREFDAPNRGREDG
jgi:hypothetical protein